MIALMSVYRLQVDASFTFVDMVNNLDHSLRFHYFYLDFYSREKSTFAWLGTIKHIPEYSGIV